MDPPTSTSTRWSPGVSAGCAPPGRAWWPAPSWPWHWSWRRPPWSPTCATPRARPSGPDRWARPSPTRTCPRRRSRARWCGRTARCCTSASAGSMSASPRRFGRATSTPSPRTRSAGSGPPTTVPSSSPTTAGSGSATGARRLRWVSWTAPASAVATWASTTASQPRGSGRTPPVHGRSGWSSRAGASPRSSCSTPPHAGSRTGGRSLPDGRARSSSAELLGDHLYWTDYGEPATSRTLRTSLTTGTTEAASEAMAAAARVTARTGPGRRGPERVTESDAQTFMVTDSHRLRGLGVDGRARGPGAAIRIRRPGHRGEAEVPMAPEDLRVVGQRGLTLFAWLDRDRFALSATPSCSRRCGATSWSAGSRRGRARSSCASAGGRG